MPHTMPWLCPLVALWHPGGGRWLCHVVPVQLHGLGTSWVLLGDAGCPVPPHVCAATCSHFGCHGCSEAHGMGTSLPRSLTPWDGRAVLWGARVGTTMPHPSPWHCTGAVHPPPKNPYETKVLPPSNASRTPNLPGQPPAVSPPPLALILRASPAPHLALGMGHHPQQLSSGSPLTPAKGTAPGGLCRAAVPPAPAVLHQPWGWGQRGSPGLGG